MKKIGLKIVLLAVLACFMVTSCDDMKALMSLIPKFDGKLPNAISGKFAHFSNEANMEIGNYDILYTFNSIEGTFKRESSTGISDTPKTETGTYSVAYDTYTITESNGKIYLTFENGTSEILGFYYFATATTGPEYIKLSDKKTYYYWGK